MDIIKVQMMMVVFFLVGLGARGERGGSGVCGGGGMGGGGIVSGKSVAVAKKVMLTLDPESIRAPDGMIRLHGGRGRGRESEGGGNEGKGVEGREWMKKQKKVDGNQEIKIPKTGAKGCVKKRNNPYRGTGTRVEGGNTNEWDRWDRAIGGRALFLSEVV